MPASFLSRLGKLRTPTPAPRTPRPPRPRTRGRFGSGKALFFPNQPPPQGGPGKGHGAGSPAGRGPERKKLIIDWVMGVAGAPNGQRTRARAALRGRGGAARAHLRAPQLSGTIPGRWRRSGSRSRSGAGGGASMCCGLDCVSLGSSRAGNGAAAAGPLRALLGGGAGARDGRWARSPGADGAAGGGPSPRRGPAARAPRAVAQPPPSCRPSFFLLFPSF